MMLVQRLPLAPHVGPVRARVLQALARHHAIFEFDTAEDLSHFLDGLEGKLLARGQVGLTRVLLVCAQPAQLIPDIKRRMASGRDLFAFTAPGCWAQFARRLDADPSLERGVYPIARSVQ